MKFHMGISRFSDRNFSNAITPNTGLKCGDPKDEPKNRGGTHATVLESLQPQTAREVKWFSIYHWELLVSAGSQFNEQKLKRRWIIFHFYQFLLLSVNYRFYSSFSKRHKNQSASLIRGTIQPKNILASGVSWLHVRCPLPSTQRTL
jgi:hypothetical protein